MSVTVCEAHHVRNMNMNKAVATRLFRMLAVTEQTAATVKRDHASYAKLNLLTEQMKLVQAQAQQTVTKSVAKAQAAAAGDITIEETCTALVSSEYDEGAKRLLTIMSVDEKTATTIKKDAPACAKLSLLSEQAALLQQQAQQAINESEVNSHLFEVAARITCKLVAGTMYYHYTTRGEEVISRIASHEWAFYDEYHGKYLYDFDLTFRRQPEIDFAAPDADDDMCGAPAMLTLLPSVAATPSIADADMADDEPRVYKKPNLASTDVLSRFG